MNSERGNYFYLKQAKGNAESCNASQEFSIYYTINDGDENSNLTFYYLVTKVNTMYCFILQGYFSGEIKQQGR